MINVGRTLLQVLLLAAFAAVIGYFADSPEYRYADPGTAVIKLSLNHAARRVKPCVRLSPEEVAKLAPNMRRTESCERERLALIVELDIDGRTLVTARAEPSGVWGDGPASIYQKIALPPGQYRLSARLRDSDRVTGWDYEYSARLRLDAGRYRTVTFNAESGGFEIL